MERPVPMDRLICGDVGYGKTEIAVRAAFKAVQDGKQVAVLVPTTLLVQQHLSTFSERFAAFPVVVKPISRFQTNAEVAETLRGLADGTVDLVIGTHRLLSPETRFKNLGLVIIDEEQRFGVEHKEQPQADAHRGRRARHVGHADPAHAGDGAHRHQGDVDDPHPARGAAPGADLRRARTTRSRSPRPSGASCSATARSSSCTTGSARSTRSPRACPSWCPRRAIAVAHGQMNEHQLEKIMVDFWENELRRAGRHHDRGVRPGHPERQHPDRRPGRHVRPVPAAPAARPGRPGQRARVRLLPVPAGEPADRDRPRAAGHHRPAHRDGRGHVRGDEGPGDPRGRQPARRRAVRAHRGGRLRPVRAHDRRGRQRAARRRARRKRPRSRSSCRSTRTSRTTTCRASGCGWRPTAGSPESAPRSGRTWTRRSPRCSRSSPTGSGRRRCRC